MGFAVVGVKFDIFRVFALGWFGVLIPLLGFCLIKLYTVSVGFVRGWLLWFILGCLVGP